MAPLAAKGRPITPDLLGQIPEDDGIDTVSADGAYDNRRCYYAIIDRLAYALIPIRRNGRTCKVLSCRNHPCHPALWQG